MTLSVLCKRVVDSNRRGLMQRMEWSSSVTGAFKRMSRAIGGPLARATGHEEMPRNFPDIVPLTRAVICIDCEAITQGIHECPACGSLSLLSVARILNRTPRVRARIGPVDVAIPSTR
jgi:hypothetical protein